MTKQLTRNTSIAAIINLIIAYPAYAAVPNTFSAGEAASAAAVNENFTSLDSRLDALETANLPPSENVSINCTADAEALKNAMITKNTTYNITGACNGPINIGEDNVHLLGSNNATDSIVLPSGLFASAVFGQGAYNLKISNLFLDLTATSSDDDTAGIWARSSFIEMRDSRIEGGTYGINPFRSSIVKLEGTNSITEFSNSGLNAGDHSNINVRGPVTVSSSNTENQVVALAASSSSNIDIRSDITVEVPVSNDSRAIGIHTNASMRIRDGGTVSITGEIKSDRNSSIRIDKGTINGDVSIRHSSAADFNNGIIVNGEVEVREGSSFKMNGGSVSDELDIRDSSIVKVEDVSIAGRIRVRNGSTADLYAVTQTSDASRALDISFNSTLDAEDSHLGNIEASYNSSVRISTDESDASIKGAFIHLSSIGSFRDITSTDDIAASLIAQINLSGSSDLGGNNLYLCDMPHWVEDTVIGIGNGSTAEEECAP